MKTAGGQFTFSSGWEVPKWYAREGDDASYKPSYFRTNWFHPVGREVKNTMENVTVADISPFAKLMVRGKGARKFLDYMVANKIPEVGIYSIFINFPLSPEQYLKNSNFRNPVEFSKFSLALVERSVSFRAVYLIFSHSIKSYSKTYYFLRLVERT